MKKSYELHPHVFLSDWVNPNLNLVKGKGFYQWDADGNQYIDSCSGAMNASLGYGREDMAEVLKKQALELGYLTRFTSVPSILDECSKVLADFTGMDRFFLTSGGSEAVEMAARIAKAYWVHKGKPTKNKIMSRWLSYHGNTFLTACFGGNIARRSDMSAYAIDEGHIAPPTCYHCPFEKRPESCDFECANELEYELINRGPDNYAGFLFEPIGGTTTAGMTPPEGYFKRIKEICDKYELLVITDDVLAGYGRTGKPLSTDWFGIQPDIVAIAKCMSGGYFPVGAAAVNERVSDLFKEVGYYYAGFTWAGNPMACAVTIETTRIMERENMLENINTQGDYMREELIKMRDRHPLIGDVRGKGLLTGVELVKDHETRTCLPNEQMALAKLMKAGFDNGVILSAASGKMKRGIEGDAFILTPYYGITREETDLLLEKLDTIITQTEKQLDFN
ncbi:MAG: aspartate aminotransferase family protein [Eubacteriaceae bacterium]|jgi:adenosylmethionine-8-amino-7-oxononanoate aminotransferase|nr:aspartate aminotransferase family protein [Eubacteriaceae bacterium]